jgi:hypothetical protein
LGAFFRGMMDLGIPLYITLKGVDFRRKSKDIPIVSKRPNSQKQPLKKMRQKFFFKS